MPYSSSWIALEPSVWAILLHYLFHDSSYFAHKMLLCIGDLCNFGIFHSELKHDCGGNGGFTSRVIRNLWEKKWWNLKCSLKKTCFKRTLLIPLSLAPPWIIPSLHYFGWFREGVWWQICFWFLCVLKLNNLLRAFLLEQKLYTVLFITWCD